MTWRVARLALAFATRPRPGPTISDIGSEGHTGAIKLLVALGVTIAVGNEGEWTPLNTAAEDGKFHAVKLLLD